MNNQRTSLELSKKLRENGCNKIDREYYWLNHGGGYEDLAPKHYAYGSKNPIPAYDLLWDICIKFAKEFFGDKYGDIEQFNSLTGDLESDNVVAYVVEYLQKGKYQEAEDYIWSNCLFNPLNKKEQTK